MNVGLPLGQTQLPAALLGSGPFRTFQRWVLLQAWLRIAFLLGVWMLRVGVQVETETNQTTLLDSVQVEGVRWWCYCRPPATSAFYRGQVSRSGGGGCEGPRIGTRGATSFLQLSALRS